MQQLRISGFESAAIFRPKRPSWLRARLRTLANRLGAAAITVCTAGHAWRIAPYRLRYPEIDMPLRGLAPSFAGMRIAQVSDLHAGRSTPLSFIASAVEELNRMAPDIVVLTGDFVSHSRRHVVELCEVLARLRSRAFAVLGNHDYSETLETWASDEVARALEAGLSAAGITVLRNSAVAIQHDDGRLWLVGLDDIWTDTFDPAAAFSAVSVDEPVIALAHNPDSLYALAPFGPQWILAGHTHGGQIRLPLLGAMVLPLENKHLVAGHFRLGQTRMYVTTGLGARIMVRFRCPPEVPVFTLRREDEHAAASRGVLASQSDRGPLQSGHETPGHIG